MVDRARQGKQSVHLCRFCHCSRHPRCIQTCPQPHMCGSGKALAQPTPAPLHHTAVLANPRHHSTALVNMRVGIGARHTSGRKSAVMASSPPRPTCPRLLADHERSGWRSEGYITRAPCLHPNLPSHPVKQLSSRLHRVTRSSHFAHSESQNGQPGSLNRLADTRVIDKLGRL